MRKRKIAWVLCLIVISQSPFYRCARKISRFARNDDMGESGILVSPPSASGNGDALEADRVLSLIASLRRFFSLIFIPTVPYPSRFARHLPHAGKAYDTGKRYSRILDFTDFSRRLRFCMPVE